MLFINRIMIRKEDLRIGSMVYAHDQSWIVKVIDPIRGCIIAYGETDLDEKCNYIKIRETVLSGIPITEEKLIEAGFEEHDDLFYQHFNIKEYWFSVMISRVGVAWQVHLQNESDLRPFKMSLIGFVHELQNMIHGICGEELKFKDK